MYTNHGQGGLCSQVEVVPSSPGRWLSFLKSVFQMYQITERVEVFDRQHYCRRSKTSPLILYCFNQKSMI